MTKAPVANSTPSIAANATRPLATDETLDTAADATPSYSIGELAREFGLTTRAIRFYEDCGLLAPERAGRNRIYTGRDRARLTLTLRGKRLGLKLAEVKELVDMYESHGHSGQGRSEPQLRRFLEVLARQRAQLEERLGELRSTLDEVLAQQATVKRLLKARSQP